MDYNQLKLLYEQIYTISLEIETLINENKHEEIMATATRRDKLLLQLEEVKGSFDATEKYPDEILELLNALKAQELKNMERLEQIKDEIKKELDKTNKENKILSAYSPSTTMETSSIVDIRE